MARVTRLTEVTEENVSDLNSLMRELRGDGSAPATVEAVSQVVANPDTRMIVANDEGRIVGIATLFIIRKIGKKTGHLEDVVVAPSHRRQGLGQAIVRMAIDIAREEHLSNVSLTSRYVHTEAHALYKKLGFVTKDAAVFKFKI